MDVNVKFAHAGGQDFWALRSPKWKWKNTTPPDAVLVVYANDFAVGALRIFKNRILSSVSCDFDAVGIGGVWVVPEYRGKGLATKLMEKALKMRGELYDAPVVLLFSNRRNLYRRVGFTDIMPAGKESLWAASTVSGIRFHGHIPWSMQPPDHF